jgi:hypothetical protein
MKKYLLIALFAPLISFADSITIEYTNDQSDLLAKHVLKCKPVAIAKLQAQADSYGIKVDMNSLRISSSSNRYIAKYLGWTVNVVDIGTRTDLFPEGKPRTLGKLTQMPLFGECF